MPLNELLASSWWPYPTLLTGVSVLATVVAFKAANAEREGTSKHRHLERAGFAFLGNSVLDLALLAILLVAHALVATDDF